MSSVDDFTMSTSQLGDDDLRRLAYIHSVLSDDAGLSLPVRGWHANLVRGIAQVKAARRAALYALELDLDSGDDEVGGIVEPGTDPLAGAAEALREAARRHVEDEP